MYVLAESEVFLNKETIFTTSGNLLEIHENGKFTIEAGFDWSAAGANEYLNGKMNIVGKGITTLDIGDEGHYSPIIVTTVNLDDEFGVKYVRSSPTDAIINPNLADYKLSDTEHWLVSKIGGASDGLFLNQIIADPEATYDTESGCASEKLVNLEDSWNEYDGGTSIREFCFVSSCSTLSEMKILENEFLGVRNPVGVNEDICFPDIFDQRGLISVFDFSGRIILQCEPNECFKIKREGLYVVKLLYFTGGMVGEYIKSIVVL